MAQVIVALDYASAPEALRLMELMTTGDREAEEMWLLVSGNLKTLVDGIENAPLPVDDWRGHLRDL